ncbi:MAG: DHH family phosphoesterase [Candidatus Micrarchaeota archaeon]|nr:DHH family phosphoesterase [Candidatus Micrarchaeota archaeon]
MKEIRDSGSLAKLLQSYSGKRALLTFHSMGDTDAIASSLILSKFFKSYSVATPDTITSHSKSILKKLGFDPESITDDFDGSAQLVILSDVNNFEDCGAFRQKLKDFVGTIIVIDHHAPKQVSKEILVYDDEGYNSASSIVFDVVEQSGIRLSRNEAKLLALGIISDSAELMNSTPQTFMQIGRLLEAGGTDYSTLSLMLKSTPSVNDRYTGVKDLFSAKREIISGRLFVYGRSSYQANHMADDAIKIGADISLFHTVSRKEISFSARMRPELEQSGVHLGVIMRGLAGIINGSGGGHPSAAGAYGTGKSKSAEFTDAFLREVVKRLKTK